MRNKWKEMYLDVSTERDVLAREAQQFYEESIRMLEVLKDVRQELEAERKKTEKVKIAILNEGPQPKFHRAVMKKHRKEWKTLWDALDELIQE